MYYGSDYFETCFNCAVQLIKDGKAYVDDLTQEEMSHFTAILQKPESVSGAKQALEDYMRIVREESARRSDEDGLDPLLAAKEKYKFKKGYGGKNP